MQLFSYQALSFLCQVHDAGPALRRYGRQFPPGFQPRVHRLAEISRTLARLRGPSFYGDEAAGKAPQDLGPRGLPRPTPAPRRQVDG